MRIHRLNFDLNAILTSPIFLWLISIAASILMWVYVTGMDESTYITRKFTCPLEYRGLDAQSILRGRLSEVDVELKGPEDAMFRLDYSTVKAFVDARYLEPGKRYTVNINVEAPSSITLVSVYPSQAVMDIVREVTRLMAVDTVLPSDIPQGYYIDGAEVIPREVGIRGAEDDIAKVGSVRITPSIQELSSSREFMTAVKFSQSEPFDGSVAIEPPMVRFRGVLVRGLPRKRVPVLVRLSGLLNADYELRSIMTEPSEVQIEGEAEGISRIDAVYTEVLDVSGMNSDRVIVAPLKPPATEEVRIIDATSAKVTISLRAALAERVLLNIPVIIRGTSRPENWVSQPSSVNVTIEGKPSYIANFVGEKEKLSVYVDMSNIFMSPVTLPVRAEIVSEDDAVRIKLIDPVNVTVNTLDR